MNYLPVQRGFTLVELVTVILLIGILVVSVAPKFDGTAGYEAHSHRVQLISALRLTQQRAMQQTDVTNSYCHQIVFDPDYSRYGIPDRTNCSITAFPSPVDWVGDATGHLVDDRYLITFSIIKDGAIAPEPQTVSFDWLGRPSGSCAGGCIINVVSTVQTLQISIEAEGYIHVFGNLP